MIAAVAFVPGPPALVPAVGAGATELADLRAAVRQCLIDAANAAQHVIIVGLGNAGQNPIALTTNGFADFGGLGVRLRISLNGADGEPIATTHAVAHPNAQGIGHNEAHGVYVNAAHGLDVDDMHRIDLDHPHGVNPTRFPVAVGTALWALDEAGISLPRSAVTVTPNSVATVAPLVPQVPTALVVVGDGTAKRTAKSPGYIDDRAIGFDEEIRAALGSGSPTNLAGLDAELADELMVSGLAPWQAAARWCAGERTFTGELRYADAPYGVDYPVAIWR